MLLAIQNVQKGLQSKLRNSNDVPMFTKLKTLKKKPMPQPTNQQRGIACLPRGIQE
jgi:hypothetical protein